MMSERELILALARVIIAAAWADGDMAVEEINSLKDLLFQLPHIGRERVMQITEREWAMLDMYIESPVSAGERARLVEQLQAALRTSKDRALALSALENIVQADGQVTEEERAVAEEIKAAIETADAGIAGQLGRLIRGAVQRRSQAVADAPNREEYLEDFIKNKVYYAVRQRLNLSEAELHVPEADLRKLSLAGGLMGRVAHVDREVVEGEFEAMVDALQAGWDISREAAALVAEVAVSEIGAGLDHFRLSREFCTGTTEDERVRFLDVLFAVADADGRVSHDEIEEIRRIAKMLHLTHKQFIDAKLKIPQERLAS
jgi:uncharacterized tellurite resistance protein B-like protein